jgi:hypothetical protein
MVICLTPYLVYELPYQQFRTAEKTAYPLFVELDKKVYEQFPRPIGVEIEENTEFENFSESGFHGHMIIMKYLIDHNRTNIDDVLSYYELLLKSKGWLPLREKSQYGLRYHNGTACLTLGTIPDNHNIISYYDVTISHDFEGQSFSPKLPPAWVIFFHEIKYDGTYIESCP